MMHMQNSAKELLHSLPIEVEFAGFRGNTLSLAKAGWDLSMRQDTIAAYGGVGMQLAMRHEGAKLYAISHRINIDHGDLYRHMQSMVGYAEFISQQIFRIQAVSPSIRFYVMATMGSMVSEFDAIDPFPQERVEESIEDFKFFKVANPTIKDIIVSPDQVPELLDLVLRAQKPTMNNVRGRERSRENKIWVDENMRGTKPAHQVQAQLITLCA